MTERRCRQLRILWYLSSLTVHTGVVSTVRPLSLRAMWPGNIMPFSKTCMCIVYCNVMLLTSIKQLGQLIKEGKLPTEIACLHLLITEPLGAGSNTVPVINKTLFCKRRDKCWRCMFCASCLISCLIHPPALTGMKQTVEISWRMKDQLDVTCYFISLIMRSTCFGH